ncbi:GH92 family glycosyl hydrolase [Actinacidiphila guanduensis]|uniref:Alpha-1,2-mannosidase, putative n=1 Tax=Actinacidiphila guanduensis TaxID=310781 RepID=A0A1H0HNU9_9ACTN|nr:GH92 family glycosyl hydrolase [Actinacidiphila guanduensis]SDO20838.1 alpha-1,2-mannosidase, putative [Actinacidiphila guanduensis]
MTEHGDPFSRRGFLLAGGGAAALAALGSAAPAAAAGSPPAGPVPPAASGAAATAGRAAVDWINPFTGALTTSPDTACGKTFPGAVVPYGLVQLSPDTVSGGDNGSGYSADMTTIEGFSFLHLSGIGCYGDLGQVQVQPQTGDLVTGRDAAKSPFDKATEQAEAGYYSVELDRYGVRVELTAAERAGMLRCTFHEAGTGRLKVDLSRRIGFDGSHTVTQELRLVDAHTVAGSMTADRSGGGWICGNGPTYTVYFCMRFQLPISELGTWDGEKVTRGATAQSGASDSAGFFVEFPVHAGQQVLAKAGISFTGLDGARGNLESSLPDWDFDGARAAARGSWSRAVAKVAAKGGTDEQREIFYSALYHTMIDPRVSSDADGASRFGDGPIRHDGFTQRTVFSGWDVFRAQFPLLTIIDEQVVADQVNTLLALTGSGAVKGLARWELLGTDTDTMIGDPAVNAIAEAYLKGVRGFDADTAYRYCRDVALGPAEVTNRNDFAHWSTLGYCVDTSLSTTLENCYSDYALSRFARATGHHADATALERTAQNYRNLFDPAVGWFRGRNADGSWMGDQDGCVESNPEQQGWFVPHDIEGLAGLLGGREAFNTRLDAIFAQTPPADMMKWNDRYNHSNEPVHQMAFMFVYTGAPWLTQKWSRYVCANAYATGPAGLAGNDDCGQMSAWYVLAAAGFYPVAPASGVYALASPLFDEVAFTTSRGTRFTIEARHNSAQNLYVQSATLDGRPLHRAWITHEEIVRGGRLTFVMGAEPNTAWGSDPKWAPPAGR